MIININRHISHIVALVAICALVVLTACSSERYVDEPSMPDDSDDTRCMMSFYVNLGIRGGGRGLYEGSRATPPSGDQYRDGSDFENYIDMTDYQVYLFTTDNLLIAHLTDPEVLPLTHLSIESVSSVSSLYRVLFRVDRVLQDAVKTPQSFKILLLANWGTYPAALMPGVTTIDDLTAQAAAAVGNYDPSDVPDKIPFFGVQQYDDVVFELDEVSKPSERLLLLRAFAKIDVWDNVNTKMKIQGVKVSRFNSKFFNAPTGVNHNDQYTGPDHYGYDYDYVDNPSLPVNPYQWESDGTVQLTKTADGHFVGYIPEYKNIGRPDPENQTKLILDYGDGGTRYVVDFKYYDNPPAGSSIGDPYDVRRNYWYQFIVNRQNSELIISADVLPYHVVELNPDFGLPQPND